VKFKDRAQQREYAKRRDEIARDGQAKARANKLATSLGE